MIKIAKSVAASIPDFELRVAAHASEMREWAAQMKIAKEHEGNDKIPPLERYVERPRPREADVVESAVNEANDAEYEIVDDGPTPAQRLEARRAELAAAVSRAEEAEVAKVISPLKVRLHEIRRSDIAASDAALIQGAMRDVDAERVKFTDLSQRHFDAAARLAAKPGIIGAVIKAVVGKSDDVVLLEAQEKELSARMATQAGRVKDAEDWWSDHGELLRQKRDPADHQFMLDHQAKVEHIDKIRRWAAGALSEIADLTVDDVDSWSIPAPPEQKA